MGSEYQTSHGNIKLTTHLQYPITTLIGRVGLDIRQYTMVMVMVVVVMVMAVMVMVVVVMVMAIWWWW